MFRPSLPVSSPPPPLNNDFSAHSYVNVPARFFVGGQRQNLGKVTVCGVGCLLGASCLAWLLVIFY